MEEGEEPKVEDIGEDGDADKGGDKDKKKKKIKVKFIDDIIAKKWLF